MGLDFTMWRMKMSRMERLLTSEEACMAFLDVHFPDPDKEPIEESDNEQKLKLSIAPEDNGLYLGKSWHLLHYLITGNDDNVDSIQNIRATRDRLGNLIVKFNLEDLLAPGDCLIIDVGINDLLVVVLMDDGTEREGEDDLLLVSHQGPGSD